MVETAAVQSFYGRWARAYDWLATAPVVTGWRERVADALELSRGDTVVEFGCGTGANLPALRERVGPEGRVVGVDLTAGMLDQARERRREAGWTNVEFVSGDATAAPIAGPVDAVLATFVVGMFDRPAAVVADWQELLGPGGRIALLDAAPSDCTLAKPLNLGFRLFTRVSAPASRTDRHSPARALEARIEAAHGQVRADSDDWRSERFGLGFLRLCAGRRSPSASQHSDAGVSTSS